VSAAGSAVAPWLSPKQLAAKLGVSPPTVVNWVHQGIIPAEVATGRIWRFDEQKVFAALKEQAERRAR